MCKWTFRLRAEPKRWIRVAAPAPAKPAWRFARSARSLAGVPISACGRRKPRYVATSPKVGYWPEADVGFRPIPDLQQVLIN